MDETTDNLLATKGMSMTDEYIYHTKKAIEQYGPKTFVCLQGGDFYEILGHDENYEPFNICRDILCIRIASRNKTSNSDYVAGYPMHSYKPFETKLLLNGYTIVYVTQLKKKGKNNTILRDVTRVCSPGCNTSDPTDIESTSLMVSILIEKINNVYFSYACIYDGNIGTVYIENVGGVDLEQCAISLKSHGYNEILLMLSENDDMEYTDEEVRDIKQKLEISQSLVHVRKVPHKDLKKTILEPKVYQTTALEKYFERFVTLYQDIYSNLELEECTTGDIGAMILLLEFIESRGEEFVKNIKKPKIHTKYVSDYMKCYNGVFDKLQIFGNKNATTLFSILNKTRSPGGNRRLRNNLSKPLTNHKEITFRHSKIEEFINTPNVLPFLKENLNLIDLERFIRSISLQSLLPHHIPKLEASFNKIKHIYEFFKENNVPFVPTESLWNIIDNFINEFESTFNFSNCSLTGAHIFNEGVSEELDDLFNRQKKIHEEFQNYCEQLSDLIEKGKTNLVKKTCTDRDGHYFSTTKKRASVLEGNIGDRFQGIKISKTKASYASITFDDSNKLSKELIRNERDCLELTNRTLQNILSNLYVKYGDSLYEIEEWITNVDVFYSNATTAKLYNYVKPSVVECDEGFIDTTQIRHPIIERLLESQTSKYIANDIKISSECTHLLYGVNSSGKSSLMKSIGLNIVMAQSGMWVSAKNMILAPYNKLFLRMGNSDNILDGHSSFTCEMREANTILRDVTPKSMVLADEFCASTESDSATIIVASTLETLSLKRASYLFATHLFQLLELESTRTLPGLNIKHLKVDSKNDSLIFARTLTDGPPERRDYGVIVGKKICTVPEFLKKIERNTKLLQNPMLSKKKISKSRYNKALLMEYCSICSYRPSKSHDLPLETHHILFQCTADNNGFINNIHKNEKHNLVVVCKPCHIDIHKKKVVINGYVQTDSGSKLSYEKAK